MLRKRIIALISATVMLIGVSGCSKRNDHKHNVLEKMESIVSEQSDEPISFSAYDYYNETSEEILAIEDVDRYNGTLTASEALELAEARGFDQTAPEYNFDISGEYLGDTKAAGDSDEKAPMYLTSYITSKEEVWYIYLTGDYIAAYPVSYVLNNRPDYEVILSESEEIMCYDDSENKYYRTIPKESAVKLIVVDEINAQTLEKYSEKELAKQ